MKLKCDNWHHLKHAKARIIPLSAVEAEQCSDYVTLFENHSGMYNSYSPIPLIVEITSFSQCQFVVVYMKAEEYDMLCMGHKIKLAKRVLCVFFSVFLRVS